MSHKLSASSALTVSTHTLFQTLLLTPDQFLRFLSPLDLSVSGVLATFVESTTHDTLLAWWSDSAWDEQTQQPLADPEWSAVLGMLPHLPDAFREHTRIATTLRSATCPDLSQALQTPLAGFPAQHVTPDCITPLQHNTYQIISRHLPHSQYPQGQWNTALWAIDDQGRLQSPAIWTVTYPGHLIHDHSLLAERLTAVLHTTSVPLPASRLRQICRDTSLGAWWQTTTRPASHSRTRVALAGQSKWSARTLGHPFQSSATIWLLTALDTTKAGIAATLWHPEAAVAVSAWWTDSDWDWTHQQPQHAPQVVTPIYAATTQTIIPQHTQFLTTLHSAENSPDNEVSGAFSASLTDMVIPLSYNAYHLISTPNPAEPTAKGQSAQWDLALWAVNRHGQLQGVPLWQWTTRQPSDFPHLAHRLARHLATTTRPRTATRLPQLCRRTLTPQHVTVAEWPTLSSILQHFQDHFNLSPTDSWDMFRRLLTQLYAKATGYRNVQVEANQDHWILVREQIVVTQVTDPHLECAWDDALPWAPRAVPGDQVRIPLPPAVLPSSWQIIAQTLLHNLLKETERTQYKTLAFLWQHSLQWATVLQIQTDGTAWLRIGPFDAFLPPTAQAWPWHIGERRLIWVDHPLIQPQKPIQLHVSETDTRFVKAWLLDTVPAFHHPDLQIARIARNPGATTLLAVRSTSRSRYQVTIHYPTWQPPAWAHHPLYHQEELLWVPMPAVDHDWPDVLAQLSHGTIRYHNAANRSAQIAIPHKARYIGHHGQTARLWNRLTQYHWQFVDP